MINDNWENIKPTESFQVEHEKSGDLKWVEKENERGFLWVVPFRGAGIGINGAPAYTLKKPHWKRV